MKEAQLHADSGGAADAADAEMRVWQPMHGFNLNHSSVTWRDLAFPVLYGLRNPGHVRHIDRAKAELLHTYVRHVHFEELEQMARLPGVGDIVVQRMKEAGWRIAPVRAAQMLQSAAANTTNASRLQTLTVVCVCAKAKCLTCSLNAL